MNIFGKKKPVIGNPGKSPYTAQQIEDMGVKAKEDKQHHSIVASNSSESFTSPRDSRSSVGSTSSQDNKLPNCDEMNKKDIEYNNLGYPNNCNDRVVLNNMFNNGGKSRRRRHKRSKKSRSNKKRKTFRKKRTHCK